MALSLTKSSLQNLLQDEKIHWKQKSRISWLQEGDKNTRFFHLTAKIRGTKNRIDKVEYKGNTLENHPQIKAVAVEFFFDIFNPSPAQLDPLLFQVQSKTVSPAQNSILQAVPANEEIRASIFSLNKSSSPGPDGFSGSFFTSF